jgi:hypothetical protein
LINGYYDVDHFLYCERQDLSDDLQALRKSVIAWRRNEAIDVGESATLYRFLSFAIWKLGLSKSLNISGTLCKRRVSQDPSIVKLAQRQLLMLPDEPTSQWASAAALLGDEERLPDAPFKLKLTYEAIEHWRGRRSRGVGWEPRRDATISAQAYVFLALCLGGKRHFVPQQPEDYCFARAFGYMSREEGARRWLSLSGHESNRLDEMETMLSAAQAGRPIDSRDHRIVQSVAMLSRVNKVPIRISFPDAVNKSWPQFWQFMDSAGVV